MNSSTKQIIPQHHSWLLIFETPKQPNVVSYLKTKLNAQMKVFLHPKILAFKLKTMKSSTKQQITKIQLIQKISEQNQHHTSDQKTQLFNQIQS